VPTIRLQRQRTFTVINLRFFTRKKLQVLAAP